MPATRQRAPHPVSAGSPGPRGFDLRHGKVEGEEEDAWVTCGVQCAGPIVDLPPPHTLHFLEPWYYARGLIDLSLGQKAAAKGATRRARDTRRELTVVIRIESLLPAPWVPGSRSAAQLPCCSYAR